jgi:hypothetical protein
LRHPQVARRLGEVQPLGDAGKVAQMTQFHGR